MSVLIITIIALVAVLLNAWENSYHDTSGKRNHLLQVLFILGYLSAGYFSFYGYVYTLTLVALIRLAFFNPIYNSFSKLPTFYAGSTDKLVDGMLSKLPSWLVFLVHMLALFFVLVLNIRGFQVW